MPFGFIAQLGRLLNRLRGTLFRRGRGAATDMHGAKPPELPVLPEDDLELDMLARDFSRELFAQLLLELPDQRDRMAQAHASGNIPGLRECVHQLLGAAAYCEAYELESCLRELRLALKTADPHTIDVYFRRAINIIDNTLHTCGYR